MKTVAETHAPVITFRAHPPERLVRSLARGHIAGCCCCCCCCCCCLHTVGSIVGAVLGSSFPPMPVPGGKGPTAAKLLDDELDGPAPAAPAPSAVPGMFWWGTLTASGLVSLVTVAFQGPTGIPMAMVVLVLAFPFVQLGGSLLCALMIARRADLRQGAAPWKRLGWITLGVVVGGVLGFLVMYLPIVLRR